MPLETTGLGSLQIRRVLTGLWQVSGGHGRIDPPAALDAMERYEAAGLTSWDLADHYGPAEDFVGQHRQRGAASDAVYLTKWVPQPAAMPLERVRQAIDVSRRRMGMERLDLLQFHWWDYQHPGMWQALDGLAELQADGIIANLGTTNFDTVRLDTMLRRGLPIVSNQVQYSLVDQRPAVAMAALGVQHGVGLLTYGTLCGGLLGDAWLGQPEPATQRLSTASLRKYKQMIDAWGGWPLFQDLLVACRGVAERHGASIAAVATRAILDRPGVAGVIIGARLGIADHIEDTLALDGLRLDDADRARLAAVTGRGRDLMAIIGDCGGEYR